MDILSYFQPFSRDISGLQNLTSVGGDLRLVTDALLENENLDAFQNLTSIGGDLVLDGNNFTDLSPLQNLTSINGSLQITNQLYLPSLEGLENIDYTTITDLQIYGNNSLSVCNFPNICSKLNSSARPHAQAVQPPILLAIFLMKIYTSTA